MILILVGSTSIILILAMLIVTALFISQKRKFRYRKELMEVKNNYEREVLRTQLETLSQTFEIISQELHDNVGTLISMAMVNLKMNNGDLLLHQNREAEKLLDEAMSILRDISRSINPDNIQKIGLGKTIKNETDRLKRSRVFKVDFVLQGEEFSVEPQVQIIIFRIAQEALNNAIKHSGASLVTVTLQFNDPFLSVSIRDNGKGFIYQPNRGDFMNHSGLINMNKRARLIDAKLTIFSELESGTMIQLEYSSGKELYNQNLLSKYN